MKQKTYFLIALCLAVSTVTFAQNEEQTEEPEVTTIAQELQKAEGFTVFARLVEACGLQEELNKVLDEAYEEAYQTGYVRDLPKHPSEEIGTVPEHRRYGYTLFAETDATWEAALGKQASAITLSDIKNYLVTHGLYPSASQYDNYSDENNILYQFTTYHILPQRLTPDKLVIHYNEKGYNWSTSQSYTIPVEEFYTTLGPRRLLKIYQSKESAMEDPERSDNRAGICLNRFPVLKNGRGAFIDTSDPDNNSYHESGVFQPLRGASLYEDENQGNRVVMNYIFAVNGIIYPVERLLAYTENVQNQLGLQRLRFDVASLLPEMMNNDLRRPLSSFASGSRNTRGFPVSADYPYFENLTIEQGTQFYYLSGYNRSWANYQGDEFNVIGKYDFTLKLPPVPVRGTYELRFGVSSGSNMRSIAQFSLGVDKDNLPAAGLPIDLRIGGTYKRIYNVGNQPSNIGWEDTSMEDLVYDRLVDLRLHELGYMKGPQYFTYGSDPVRNKEFNLRRVVWSGELAPEKTYYLRVQSCLDNPELQFYMDYIELCSKNVYANPETPEDIW